MYTADKRKAESLTFRVWALVSFWRKADTLETLDFAFRFIDSLQTFYFSILMLW